MNSIKRITILAITMFMSISLLYSGETTREKKEAAFMKAFGVFIEQISTDITPLNNQVEEKPSKKSKSRKAKKARKAEEVTEVKPQPFVSNDLKKQFSLLYKYKDHLNILKIGRSLDIETGYDKLADVFPKKFVHLQLGNVERFRILNPEAFAMYSNEDFCLYIKEEYGNDDDKIIYSERAIIFSAADEDNFKIIGTPTISLRDQVSAK